jgi:hypothetical protein
MSKLVRRIWRVTGESLYHRLFRRYYVATIERLNLLLAEVGGLRVEVRTLRDRLEEHLETETRTATAEEWDRMAVARRLASLEDRLDANGYAAPPEPADSAQPERNVSRPESA